VPLCLYVGVLTNFLVVHRAALPIGQSAGLGALLLALLGLDRWAAWRYGERPPRRARVLLLLGQALLVEAAIWVEGFELSVFLYLLLPFTATLAFGGRAGLAAALLVWLVFALKVLAEDPLAVAVEALVLFALAAGVVLILSQLVLRERRARERAEQVLGALRQAHAELAAAAEATAELATVRERNRLAREIHDGLGHALTALAIQLEQAQSFRTRDAERADGAVATAKGLADEALTAVRRSVGVLRVPPASLQQALETLAAALGPGPPSVTLSVDADEQWLAPATRAALLRIAQEALTNVRRHASAQHVRVHVARTGEALSVTVTDDGVGFDSAAGQQPGHGLAGIAERAALLGGRLEIVSAAGSGTTLRVVVPGEAVRQLSEPHTRQKASTYE
jgi:signal transduction histidine kinase